MQHRKSKVLTWIDARGNSWKMDEERRYKMRLKNSVWYSYSISKQDRKERRHALRICSKVTARLVGDALSSIFVVDDTQLWWGWRDRRWRISSIEDDPKTSATASCSFRNSRVGEGMDEKSFNRESTAAADGMSSSLSLWWRAWPQFHECAQGVLLAEGYNSPEFGCCAQSAWLFQDWLPPLPWHVDQWAPGTYRNWTEWCLWSKKP